MNKLKCLVCGLVILSMISCQAQEKDHSGLLIFSKTEGYRHGSIEKGAAEIREIAEQLGYQVVHTEDSKIFTSDTLPNLKVVIFLNTTGDILNDNQQKAFEEFIRSGGGFIGIHAAADTEYEWEWYGKMVGAYFNSHPKIQEAVVRQVKDHAIVNQVPAEWARRDEWYNYRDVNPAIHVLQNLDETTYEGGKMGSNHPITWFHEFNGGKVFYTGMGHTEETYDEDAFRELIRNAINYVAQ